MKKGVAQIVGETILPTVTELGYRLWDVEYKKIGADFHLEITIDSDAGISIDDCEKVHRAIEVIIDEVDPISDFYYLEVSSPGAEREIRTDEHIEATLGQKVEAKLFTSEDGRKNIVGILRGLRDGAVIIEENGNEVAIPRASISRMTTVCDIL